MRLHKPKQTLAEAKAEAMQEINFLETVIKESSARLKVLQRKMGISSSRKACNLKVAR